MYFSLFPSLHIVAFMSTFLPLFVPYHNHVIESEYKKRVSICPFTYPIIPFFLSYSLSFFESYHIDTPRIILSYLESHYVNSKERKCVISPSLRDTRQPLLLAEWELASHLPIVDRWSMILLVSFIYPVQQYTSLNV